MKRFLLTFIAIISLVNTYATGFETIGGLRYLIDTDANTATLVADTVKYSGDIVVPEKVTVAGIAYPVVALANRSFYCCDSLKSVLIPSSVTSLGEYCFFHCISLTSLTIPSSVTSLGDDCFSDCISLTSITIPTSISSLSNGCFENCTSLVSITIPSSVTSLGNYCFYRCSSLTSIPIPSSVTSLGQGCFYDCSSLVSIAIPSSITSLEEKCFSNCSSLTSIIISSSVTRFDDECFKSCSSLVSITIPSSVTCLGKKCFEECSSLSSIIIPSSVTSLGDYCFMYCSSLATVTISSSVTFLGGLCFYGCDKLNTIYCYAVYPPNTGALLRQPTTTILYVPASSVDKYKQAYSWKDFIAILPISGTKADTKGKCEKPTITFADGQLHFESSTTGANYHYTLTSADAATDVYSEDGNVSLKAAYNISAYATADGYSTSDKSTATLYWVDGRLDDPTGISSTTSAKRGIVVSSQNGKVTLSGLNDGETVNFYSISGSNLGTVKANHGVATSTFPQGQVVIVKVGKDSLKIAL